MLNKYYAMEQHGTTADITIYGDITSYPCGGDMSAALLSAQLDKLEADEINLHISSYGGEVSEGWAIYNALKNHRAKVSTYADGFVCSIAAVIFMAGDNRIMQDVSALMIHNPWTYTKGNAAELRKTADDLDTMATLSAKAFANCVNISEDRLADMLAAETWLTPDEAVEMGFATQKVTTPESGKAAQSVRETVLAKVTAPAQPTAAEIALAVAEKLQAQQATPPTTEKKLIKFLSAL